MKTIKDEHKKKNKKKTLKRQKSKTHKQANKQKNLFSLSDSQLAFESVDHFRVFSVSDGNFS